MISEVKKKALDALDAAGISYDRTDHEAMYTMEELEEAGLNKNKEIAKNLFLRNDNGKQHYLVVVREDKNADLKKIRAEIGSSRLSFASEDRLFMCMGLKKGSVSPLGVINDTENKVQVYFDKDLMQQKRIGVHPNENTTTVFIEPNVLYEFIKAQGNEISLIEV